jgi:uncharacterized protein involved in exopolysaccharide biosynthesis
MKAASEEPIGDGAGPDLLHALVRDALRSHRVVLLLILLGTAAGLGVGVLQPNRYVSNAKLFLRMGAREQLTSESLVEVDARQPSSPATMTVADEIQMLSDVALFERVARDLGPRVILQSADPARDDGPNAPWIIHLFHGAQSFLFRGMKNAGRDSDEDELRQATKVLGSAATVFAERGSNVILVSYTASSPEMAQSVARALVNTFIERHRDQFSIRSLLEKSRSQLEEARLARDAAATACVEQVDPSEILVLETQVPRLEAELTSIENDLFVARMRREEIGQLRASSSAPAPGVPAEIEIRSPSAPKTPVVGAGVRENLAARNVDLVSEDESLRINIRQLESRVNEKKAAVSELRKELLAVTMLRKDLIATRDAQESRYTHMLARVSVLQALENIDANEEANLCVLQAPTLEPEAVGPRRFSLLSRGLVFGMIAAVAYLAFRHRFEDRLCEPETFEQARGVLVLGIVPYLDSLQLRGSVVGSR